MKFYIFSAQYLPTVGGVERYTNSLAKKLIEKGHTVTVVTSALKDHPRQETDSDGIDVVRLPVIPLMGGRFPVLKISAQLKEFKKNFALDKPDFCVIQTRFYTESIMAARLCRKHNIPSMVIEHGTAYLMRGGIMGLAGKIYEHIICRYIHHKCPDFYGVSQSCCQWLENFGIKTNRVLYNSVTPGVIQKTAESGMSALLCRLPDDMHNKTVIVFSARFIPEKGVMQLLSAFEKLKRNHKDIVLIMAGDGPLWQEADAKKGNDVILTGRIPYEESLALIQLGHIFCLPTFSEGFATTVLEAAALKTYIVTTPTGGTPQLVTGPDCGTLMPDMSEDSIYSALNDILSDRSAIQPAVEKTFSSLEQNFTWDITSEKLIDIAKEKSNRGKR